MTDRDVPSVPVTTLAGLFSVSDLLSEIPISDSSVGAPLNKSLLFHPRVAEEAKNLLCMKDESLTRQLIQALEQTNSDHIELKSQYAEQQAAVTNIHELPHLLQAILNFKPTVFKTGGPQYQQQRHRNSQMHLWAQQQQQMQQQNYSNNQAQQQALRCSTNRWDADMISGPSHQQSTSASFAQQMPIGNAMQNVSQSLSAQHHLNQQQIHQIPNSNNYDQLHPPMPQPVIVKQEYPIGSMIDGLEQQTAGPNVYMENHGTTIHSSSPAQPVGAGHENIARQSMYAHQQSAYQTSGGHTQLPSHQIQQSQAMRPKQPFQSQQQYSQMPQNSHQNAINSPFDQVYGSASSIQPNSNSRQNSFTQNHFGSHRPNAVDNNTDGYPNQSYQHRANKQLLEINEILSKSKAVFSQLPKLPEQKVFPEEPPSQPADMNNLDIDAIIARPPKVSLNRLKVEDSDLMQKSLAEFAMKSPDLAKKLGVVKDESDIFQQMKANEKPHKRRNNENDGAAFSQPKLRRVETHTSYSNSKPSQDDIIKSQTYQQFMRNMEHELRNLEESEQIYNIDDIDFHNDCISMKMLGQLSNDVVKLKAKGAVDLISKSKLTLLINYAMRNVDIAKNLSAGPDIEDDSEEVIEKVLAAAEACLLVCNLYSTAKDVKFLQEDNMDKIVKFVQLQMRETIFPTFDPVFSVKSTKKPDKGKKRSSNGGGGGGGITRNVQTLYTKMVELTKIFATLFDNCAFIDTIVLAVSSLAVEPFFVDNIEAMQFACLELVTTIFRKEIYVSYRSSIFTDILTSVDRLPHSKRNLRPFKLAHNGGSIQMVTALVLQLIQSSTVLPEHLSDNGKYRKKYIVNDTENKVDKDLFIMGKYDTAVSIGGNFLTTFLNKCKSRSGESDFRPLFENFVNDLLTTVNRPEWPASELLLSLLGTLLVKYMSDKTKEQSIRVVSLEYLGIVAARLRKDTVESRCQVHTMDQLIKCIKLEQEKEGDNDGLDYKFVVDPEEERTEFLQRILLDFLAVNAHEDNFVYDYARNFYLTQWYKDALIRKRRVADGEKGFASRKKQSKKKRRFRDESESSDNDDSDDEEDVKEVKANVTDQELNLEIFRLLDERKKYLLSKIAPYSSNSSVQDIRTYIDYNNAYLIAQYLASKRQFSQSFDKYLQKIILVVREPSIGIRTKAMKCLAMIVEVDPSILKRKDMQIGVNQKFLDASISVREAAVDLVGKYILNSPDLIDQYYDMLSKRILDTGVSVRKRVIKILRDICIEYPDFDKIPEICVKMIRRVNDEEGIQKLVTEVFMRMWFMPCADNDSKLIERKINQMLDVVSMAHDTGLQWLDGLLTSIFTPKEDKDMDRTANAPKKEPPKEVVKACQQLADGLVNEIIKFEASDSKKVLSCVTTLHLLAKVRPVLLVNHGITLEPYLNVKCNSQNGLKFISCVAEILEEVVPLMKNPSESFLAELEMHLMILVLSHNQTVVHSCLSCLGAVINKITKNYKLIRDCFVRCYKPIINSRTQLQLKPNYPVENIYRPQFRRGLFTVGLIFRFFDFKQPQVFGDGLGPEDAGLPPTICDDVFEHLMFFTSLNNHNELRREALIALGHFCIKNFDYLTNSKLREMFCDILVSEKYDIHLKIIVLRNITMYLTDADASMSVKDKDWQSQSLVDNLCDMGDLISGMSSRIIQLYLKDILGSLLHSNLNVRLNSLKVVQLVLRQGLVHPIQIVPYLICLSTDSFRENAHRADHHLQEIDKQYPGFVNMKSQAGIQLSFDLQAVLQGHVESRKNIVRGFIVKEKDEQPSALNGFLYTLLRNAKPQRRALVQGIVKQFDEQRTTLRHMIYLADNLAYFPYTVQDEPLYLMHQIDLMITVSGTSLLQSFKENLKPTARSSERDPNDPSNILEDEDDEDDKEKLMARLPEDTTELQKCMTSAQGCILLLMLKQHLKALYKINDGKISRYSPSEAAKIYEKAVQRHSVPTFNPKATIEIINEEQSTNNPLTLNEKILLLERYSEFKQMMLNIDKDDSDDDSDRAISKSATTTPQKINPNDGNPNESNYVNNVNNTIVNAVDAPLQSLPKNTMNMNSHTNSSYPTTPRAAATVKATTPIHRSSTQKSHRKQPSRNKKGGRKRVASSSDEVDSECSEDNYE